MDGADRVPGSNDHSETHPIDQTRKSASLTALAGVRVADRANGQRCEQVQASDRFGKFPQAFTHLALISAAVTLDRSSDDRAGANRAAGLSDGKPT